MFLPSSDVNMSLISNIICHGLFMFNVLRWEMIVCFVDIGGIVDNQCLNFIFITCTNSALPLPYFLQTLGDYIRNGDLGVSIHFDVFYFHCLRVVGLYTGISCTWWCSCLFLKRCVVIPEIESSDWPSNIKYCIIFNTPRQ
jgi:hypothetical protein